MPVEPPSFELASIETTEGITRCARSATEPGGRSTELVTRERLIDWPKSEPEDDAPKIAPTRPATKARRMALARVMKLAFPLREAGTHHGPLLGEVIS